MGVFGFLAAKQIMNLFVIMMWFIIISLLFITCFFIKGWMKRFFNDWLILFDKDMRWHIEYVNVWGKHKIEIGKNTYVLNPKCMYLGAWGKSLILKRAGRPDDLVITDKSVEWINTENITKVFKNEEIKKVVTEKKDNESLMLFIAIALGIVLVCLIIVALKIFGVFGK